MLKTWLVAHEEMKRKKKTEKIQTFCRNESDVGKDLQKVWKQGMDEKDPRATLLQNMVYKKLHRLQNVLCNRFSAVSLFG